MICCGHILSSPYKEEEFPDPGRLAMNRNQRAEDMCNIGDYEEYVPSSLIVLQRYPGLERQRERENICWCKRFLIYVGKGEDISGVVKIDYTE